MNKKKTILIGLVVSVFVLIFLFINAIVEENEAFMIIFVLLVFIFIFVVLPSFAIKGIIKLIK